jgi:hypothetical protein
MEEFRVLSLEEWNFRKMVQDHLSNLLEQQRVYWQLRERGSNGQHWVIMSKWFYDTSTGAATGAAHCGSFVGKAFTLLVVSSM